MPDEAIHPSRFSTLTSSDGTSATVVLLFSCNQWADIDSSELEWRAFQPVQKSFPGYGLREPAETVFDEDAIWSRPLDARPTTPCSLLVVVLQPSDMLIRAERSVFGKSDLTLLNCADLRVMRTAVKDVDLARYFEDSFWMLAILTECVFERLRAAREQTSENTILLADDPVSKTIFANKDGRPGGDSGRIFDKLHDHKVHESTPSLPPQDCSHHERPWQIAVTNCGASVPNRSSISMEVYSKHEASPATNSREGRSTFASAENEQTCTAAVRDALMLSPTDPTE